MQDAWRMFEQRGDAGPTTYIWIICMHEHHHLAGFFFFLFSFFFTVGYILFHTTHVMKLLKLLLLALIALHIVALLKL
jgi:hypothetical protein